MLDCWSVGLLVSNPFPTTTATTILNMKNEAVGMLEDGYCSLTDWEMLRNTQHARLSHCVTNDQEVSTNLYSNEPFWNTSIMSQSIASKDQVIAALKFLGNPKVDFLPLETKRDFLLSKGLSQEDVVTVLKIYELSNRASPPVPWTWHERLVVAVLLFSVGYISLTYIKHYLTSWMQAHSNNFSSNQLHRIQAKVALLEQKLMTIESRYSDDAQATIARVNTLASSVRDEFAALQRDIKNVKTMLLRPTAVTAVNRNELPEWQRNAQKALLANVAPTNLDGTFDQQLSSADSPTRNMKNRTQTKT
eukprot:gene4446-6694_t